VNFIIQDGVLYVIFLPLVWETISNKATRRLLCYSAIFDSKMSIFDRLRGHSDDEEESDEGFESPSPEEVLTENSSADEL
jgi:hypothetical protein